MASYSQILSMIEENMDSKEFQPQDILDLITSLAAKVTNYQVFMANEYETIGGPRDSFSTLLDWMDLQVQCSTLIQEGKLDHDSFWDEIDKSDLYPEQAMIKAAADRGIHLEPTWSK